MIEGSFRKGKAINLDNLTVEEKETISTIATNIADMIVNPSDYNLMSELEDNNGSLTSVDSEFMVVWLDGTSEYAIVCGEEILFDGFNSEIEADIVYEHVSNMAHSIANEEILKRTIKEYLSMESGTLILDTSIHTLEANPSVNMIEHGDYIIIDETLSKNPCECGELFNSACEKCEESFVFLLEKVELNSK